LRLRYSIRRAPLTLPPFQLGERGLEPRLGSQAEPMAGLGQFGARFMARRAELGELASEEKTVAEVFIFAGDGEVLSCCPVIPGRKANPEGREVEDRIHDSSQPLDLPHLRPVGLVRNDRKNCEIRKRPRQPAIQCAALALKRPPNAGWVGGRQPATKNVDSPWGRQPYRLPYMFLFRKAANPTAAIF